MISPRFGMAALAAPILAAETTSLAARIGILLSTTAGANGLSAQIVSLLKLIGFSQRNATSLSTQLVTLALLGLLLSAAQHIALNLIAPRQTQCAERENRT